MYVFVTQGNQNTEFSVSKSNDHGGLFLSSELQIDDIHDSTTGKLINTLYIKKKIYNLFKIIYLLSQC